MLPKFSVRRPYTVVVAIVIVIILGIVSLTRMSTDLLPSINLPYALVMTAYGGASPEEVETVVTGPIEQALASLSNLKNISSISRENMSLVILEFTSNVNMDTVFIEMRETLDMIAAYLPDEVGTPLMLKLNPDMLPIMTLAAAVEGMDISESSRFIEDNILHEFESIEGVASVSATGLVENGIHVILRQDKIDQVNATIAQMLAQMGIPTDSLPSIELTRDMVAGILRGQNFSMPAGYITEAGTDYLVRTGDEIRDVEELKQLAVMVLPVPGLRPITLNDVADIAVVDNSDTMYSRLNGNDAVTISIHKQSEYSTADVAGLIRAKMEKLAQQYPDLEMVALMDQGVYVDMVVDSLTSNLLVGGALALLILIVFLRDVRPTIVVGLAIPVSLVTALVLMYFSDITLNVISMGGLALGVGMLVDNSIVVIENIYRMRSEGASAKEAAVQGAREVAGAIAASTLTTIAVFVPILFVQGMTREIFTDMGLTIAYSLLASLAIALTLVPMAASRVITKEVRQKDRVLRAVQSWYAKVLEFALRRKGLVLFIAVALLAVSIAGALSKGTQFFPDANTGQLVVRIDMPRGSTLEDTAAVADEAAEIISGIEYVEHVGASIGGGILAGPGGAGFADSVSIYVLIAEENIRHTNEVARKIREETAHLPAEVTVGDYGADMGSMLSGRGIELIVAGRDFDTLEAIAADVADIVASVEGTRDISDGIERSEPELRVVVDKDKSIAHGLTVAQVFMELKELLSAQGVTTTISVGNIDYAVRVLDEDSLREVTRADIEELVLETPQGTVPLKAIADIQEAAGYRTIRRENQQRTLTVTAGLEDGYNIGLVSRKIAAKLADYDVPDGYTVKIGGEQEMIRETFADLYLMLALAVALIYLIMVAQFQSLLSPFIVMFTVPLGFTGGFLALFLTGNPVSVVAFLGLIILTGVVVNNGIVFVDYINVLRRSGLDKREAIIRAGTVRLRPILMTALTTIIALITLSFGVGTGSEMIQPMAITTIGGLIYATALTLVLVPVLYDLLHKKDRVEPEAE
ncbi:MAG TPA: efflux RND transporter permease subunit [Bacillota bacterium]|nr:efflux RND transporter permease subunit [Bacillota bacterium]HPZ90266.1 efflux RND transporter permease subunit [Bacillota bacterium]HQE01656.1 efflux RND transporter permease subunit [Bacillota bacterium]